MGLVEHAVESRHFMVDFAAQTVVLLGHEVLQFLFTFLPVTAKAVRDCECSKEQADKDHSPSVLHE